MNKRFTFWIEDSLIEEIRKESKKYALKSSAYIRLAIIEKLEKEKNIGKKINNK